MNYAAMLRHRLGSGTMYAGPDAHRSFRFTYPARKEAERPNPISGRSPEARHGLCCDVARDGEDTHGKRGAQKPVGAGCGHRCRGHAYPVRASMTATAMT